MSASPSLGLDEGQSICAAERPLVRPVWLLVKE